MLVAGRVWLRVKNGYTKWNPGKWNQGVKPVVPWWFNCDPHPYRFLRVTHSFEPRVVSGESARSDLSFGLAGKLHPNQTPERSQAAVIFWPWAALSSKVCGGELVPRGEEEIGFSLLALLNELNSTPCLEESQG